MPRREKVEWEGVKRGGKKERKMERGRERKRYKETKERKCVEGNTK